MLPTAGAKMRSAIAILLAFVAGSSRADCTAPLPLKGTESVATCDPREPKCYPASEKLAEYLDRIDDSASVMTIALQSSPWRMYGPDSRILTADEVAALIRPHLGGRMRKVKLIGSWTGVAPSKERASLAEQVSRSLGGVRVDGFKGFLWVSPDGDFRTTRQAFTVGARSGPYAVNDGDEVMVALVDGWHMMAEPHWIEQGEADGVMRAGVGWDVFGLCPDSALASFEKSAEMGSAIGAYNAAIMRLQQGGSANENAARMLLERAVALGDAKAGEKLASLEKQRDP